jgi:FtsP/CotA-like multicopper oxidase with cupredoxin domain
MAEGHLLPVDTSLHMANPALGIPTVVHLHGGHTESASDGQTEGWYTQGWNAFGPDHVKEIYHYDNDQEAATLWYHDHALGITRLNVYAGPAGFYLLRDDNERNLVANGVLPDPNSAFEHEIVIQDRMLRQASTASGCSTDRIRGSMCFSLVIQIPLWRKRSGRLARMTVCCHSLLL